MNKSLAKALFRPRSVALVGASGDAGKNTARPQRYLTKHGYKGRILPINPGRDEIMGLPAYKSVSAAPGPVDHAFIMTPAATVPASGSPASFPTASPKPAPKGSPASVPWSTPPARPGCG